MSIMSFKDFDFNKMIPEGYLKEVYLKWIKTQSQSPNQDTDTKDKD